MTAHIIGNQANIVGLFNLRFDYKLVPVNLSYIRERKQMALSDYPDYTLWSIEILDDNNNVIDLLNKSLHTADLTNKLQDVLMQFIYENPKIIEEKG